MYPVLAEDAVKIHALLPPNREAEGTIWATDETGVIFGPERCRGEADNTAALKANNAQEDPARSHGDHPAGVYRITEVVRNPMPTDTYGPAFLRLAPVSGQAWEARRNGRSGLGIHGGRLGPGDTLRATYGCLRMDNDAVDRLAALVEKQLGAIGEVFYECHEQTATA
jgi:hypothetical protein